MAYDESGRAARCRIVTALLAVALIVLVGANLCIGSVLVPADHIPGILSGGAANSMESQVIWEIRLPRVLSAVLLGGALSLSGFLLQTFFNNPIADPFILGVSSGAKFVVALTMIVLLGANQAMSSPAMVAAAFLGSLITIGFVLKVNPVLALLLLALNLAVIYVIYRLSRGMVPVSEKRAQTMSEANGVLVDSITNAGLVKNFANYRFERRHYFKFMKTAAAADRAETKKFGEIFIWQNLFRALVQVLFYALPVWYWYIGAISVADFVLLQSLIAILSNTFSMLSMNFMQFFKVYGSIRDGLKLLSKPCDVNDVSGAVKLKVDNGAIEFANINYHYKGARFLFEGFNLRIAGGEKIGLVGRSGSGKSSLIKLLSRYYDIQRGKITIDGQDISGVTQESLRRQIALIPQDPSLFNRSIMENIRYGRPQATDEEVFDAARRAYIHDFIMRLPEGYQSKVGERGVMLSGGERQRIAIARAILKNAPILILDEATSALDSESEKYIQESLKSLMADKTVIAIAHRLSTLKEMDRIIVMDKGKIVESGSHAALIRRKGVYWGFYAMQSSGFIEVDEDTPCSK